MQQETSPRYPIRLDAHSATLCVTAIHSSGFPPGTSSAMLLPFSRI